MSAFPILTERCGERPVLVGGFKPCRGWVCPWEDEGYRPEVVPQISMPRSDR